MATKMHWCSCKVNLSGQGFTIFNFDASNPVSWPEVQVLMALHGEENVYDIKPVAIADVSPTDEKRRLLGKYGRNVEAVFPGRVFRMQMLMPAESTDQPEADIEGVVIGHENGKPQPPPPDDDEDEDEPPATAGPAVFKPGKHPRPQKAP